MARPKPENEMTATSISIERDLLERLKYAAGQFGVSVVLAQLGEKWLSGDVEIMLKPRKDKEDD